MANRFQPYAYNFNPREGPKQNKLRYLMKTGVMDRKSIPIGLIKSDTKFQSKCRQQYKFYNECLQFNKFDRAICQQYEKQVISCQHRQNLFPTNQAVLKRLRQGLQNCKKRKEAINAKLKEKYQSKKYSKQNNYKTTDSDNLESFSSLAEQSEEIKTNFNQQED